MAKFDKGSRKGKDFVKRHVPVESSMMGYIIGKGGQMIKTIESETGSRISSVKDGFMVKGTEEQYAKALQKINDILTSVQSRRRRSHMGSCSGTNPPRQVDGRDNIFGPHPKMTKMISFLTSLEDEDEVKFIKYEGQTPKVWASSKNPKMYCLEAVKKDEIESQCDSLERMKNYPMLENAVKENLTRILKKEEPVPVQLEIRL
jgi:rRNA processing protein Krr1/Pno1